MLQFAMFMEKENPHSFFHFELLYFFPYECPGLCWHRPRHSLGKNEMAQNEKLSDFTYSKNMLNFEEYH